MRQDRVLLEGWAWWVGKSRAREKWPPHQAIDGKFSTWEAQPQPKGGGYAVLCSFARRDGGGCCRAWRQASCLNIQWHVRAAGVGTPPAGVFGKGQLWGRAGKGTVGVLGFGSGTLRRARLAARLHGKACAFGRAKVASRGCCPRRRTSQAGLIARKEARICSA